MAGDRKQKKPRVKKPKKHNPNTFARGVLRRASLKWPPRKECLQLARVSRGLYKCAICEELFKWYQVHVDHINPIIDVKLGFTTWDDYIPRLFCDVSGLQCLCEACHDGKTRVEDEMRTFYEREKKKVKK